MGTTSFAERYGRWALVAGASEGVGAYTADELAARGLDLVLVSRNATLLEEIADGIRDRHRREVRTLPLDLTGPDLVERVGAATSGLEVGLLVYNAGAVHHMGPFLDKPVDFWDWQVDLNVTAPMALVHLLAPAMAERGRGGLVLVGSSGCVVGAPQIVVYSAAKMFQVNLVEGLYAELHPQGVDVCSAVIGGTATPARERELGVTFDPEREMLADETARVIADNIANGPIVLIGPQSTALGEGWLEQRQATMAKLYAAMKTFGK